MARKKKKEVKKKEVKTVPWLDSVGKELLRRDILAGKVSLNNDDKPIEVFKMRPQYSCDAAADGTAKTVPVKLQTFASRLYGIRKQILAGKTRAEKDRESFENFKANHTAKSMTARGYPQWAHSKAKDLLCKDMDNGKHTAFKKIQKNSGAEVPDQQSFWRSRSEYLEFPLEVFRKHIHQELKTRKYINLLEHNGGKKDPYYLANEVDPASRPVRN